MVRPSASCCKARTTWAADPIAIVLHHRGGGNSRDDFTGKDTIVFELIEPMIGNEVVAAEHERLHAAQSLAHVPNQRMITPPRRPRASPCRCAGGRRPA